MSDRAPDGPLMDREESIDLNRPSLFELLAEGQLRDLLHPVVRYVLSYLAQRYPRYLLRLLNHHEEVFAALLLGIEHHHLRKHNASLTEHFYGLQLVPASPVPVDISNTTGRRRLSRRQRWGLLLFLVGIPYLRARAQDYYERLNGRDVVDGSAVSDNVPSSTLTTSQKWFRRIYPYINLSFDLYLLANDLAFLFGKTDWYRPWHRLLRVRLQRVDSDEDGTDLAPTTRSSHLPPLLPPLLLLLKLSQWWYSPDSPRSLSVDTDSLTSKVHKAIPPPPPLPILPSSGLLTPPPTPPDCQDPNTGYRITPEEYGKCPLCKKKWQNPAVLPSGWVVCWRCGWDAIEGEDEDEPVPMPQEPETQISSEKIPSGRGRRKGRCPITGMAVAPGELRRVLI